MSVMQCDRRGCEEILCKRLILGGTQYICDICWGELLQAKAKWPEGTDVRAEIESFMDSNVGSTLSVDEQFDLLTK